MRKGLYFFIFMIGITFLFGSDKTLKQKSTVIKTLQFKQKEVDLFGIEYIIPSTDNGFYLIYPKLNRIIRIDSVLNVQWIYDNNKTGPGGLELPTHVFEHNNLLYIANSSRYSIVILNAVTGKYIDEIILRDKFIRPEQICILNDRLIIKSTTMVNPFKQSKKGNFIVSFKLKNPLSIDFSDQISLEPKDYDSFLATAVINNLVNIFSSGSELILTFRLGDRNVIILNEKLEIVEKRKFPVRNSIEKLYKSGYKIESEREIKKKIPQCYQSICFSKSNLYFTQQDSLFCWDLGGSVYKVKELQPRVDVFCINNSVFLGYNADENMLIRFPLQIEKKQNFIKASNLIENFKLSTEPVALYFVTENCGVCLKTVELLRMSITQLKFEVFLVVLPEQGYIINDLPGELPVILDGQHRLFKDFNKKIQPLLLLLNNKGIIKSFTFYELLEIESSVELIAKINGAL